MGKESSFTDEDISLLKSKEGYWKTTVKMNEGQSESWGFVDGNKIDALIRRLEAAEVLLERLTNPDEEYELEDVDKDHNYYLAWRTSAGKGK